MGTTIESLIHEMAFRVRLLRMLQGAAKKTGALTERDTTMLELINYKGQMNISEIASLYPSVSSSTISNTITKLWKVDKLVDKNINPDNQRITNVSLSKKGIKAIKDIKEADSNSFKTIVKALDLSTEEEKVFNKVLKKAIVFFDGIIHPET